MPSLEEIPSLDEQQQQEEELLPLDSFEEDEELRGIRLEGAIPLTPAPDNSVYLEGDPFVLNDSGFESASFDEDTSESVLLEETTSHDVISGDTISEAAISQDTVLEDAISADAMSGENDADLTFDEINFDLNLDDVSAESPALPEEMLSDGLVLESPAPSEAETEETGSEQEQVLDTGSPDFGETAMDEMDFSAGIVEPPLEEPILDDISFGDDISLDMDDFVTNIDLNDNDKEDGLADETDALAIDDIANDLAIDDFGTSAGLDVKDDNLDDGLADTLADDSLDGGLTGVIPEGFEINAEEAPASLDDDLEAFADDLSDDLSGDSGEISLSEAPAANAVEADTGDDIDIPANFKSELKSVLSYMDHLLESLPEDKIEEFARSEYFDSYKKIFKELGLV
jgi:hypothetical protein